MVVEQGRRITQNGRGKIRKVHHPFHFTMGPEANTGRRKL
jgi:hypothetical protein